MLKWGSLYQDNKTGQVCKHFPCHQGQLDVLQSEARYVALIGGVNGGKTSGGALKLMKEVERFNGLGQFLVLGPTADVVLSSTLQSWVSTVKGTALQGKFVGSTNNPHYQMGTGGIIYFRSAYADYQGLKPQTILIDEAGNISEQAWNTAKTRILGTDGGRIILATTPYLQHDWISRIIIGNADKGDPDYFYRSFPSHLNPTTDLKLLEAERIALPEWEFDMKYNGNFTRMPGLVYDFTSADGEPGFVQVDRNFRFPEAAAYFGAIDWGGNDPHCWIVGLLDHNGCLWIIAEYYKPGDIVSVFDSIDEWHSTFHKATGQRVKWWFCDHQKSAILSLRKKGHVARSAPKGPESIPLGIGLVQSRIRRGKLKVCLPQCPNIQGESKLYRYPMADGITVGNRPIDKDNHAMDALRYMVLGLDRKEIGKHLRQAS